MRRSLRSLAMTSEPAVAATAVTKRYGDRLAVNALTLEVPDGAVYGVLGPNGAGKTTFLRMVFGLVRPDDGTLRVFGRTWGTDGPRTLDGVAGFIESPRFYPGLTGRRNLQLLAGLDGGVPAARIDEVLEVVDLTGRDRDKVGGYSYGMRQRLGVAASLLRDPRLLVLDEPANGLDPAGIRDMRALVTRLAGSGLTVLLSSHDMGEVEQVCDDVTIMRTGDVVYHGSIEDLRATAPDPAHTVRTTDDRRSTDLARLRGLQVEVAGDGLAVRGAQAQVDGLVADLVREGIALRTLSLEKTPLETLFFQLTEEAA